jgi:formamidopyrimidine-DNA glycosylase
MDQKKMSGVGNIYANDALFEARIDPRRKAKNLSEEEIRKLYDAILKVLKKGLESGGASELSFVNVLGQEGGYQNHFLVYGREKEPCRACKTPIQKIKLSGRGTYFCPSCQR